MAERATDLLDIERRLVARLVGEPEPGVALPDVPSVLVADDLAPGRHRRPRPGAGPRAGDREGRRHQPHRDHRAPARHPVRGRRRRRTRPAGRRLGARRRDRRHRRRVRRGGRRGGQGRRRTAPAARRSSRGPDPPRPPTASHVKLLANVADGESARHAVAGAGRGRRACSAPSCASSTAATSRPSRSRPTIYGEVLDAFKGEGQYVVVRTLDAGSDKPIAFATLEDEENPALGVRGLRLALNNPGLMERQLDGIAAAASRVGHRDVGDGADGRHRGRGRRLRRSRSATAGSRPASWSRCRAPRCWPTGCSRSSTSCPSAPTT